MKLQSFQQSHVGNVRKTNEDHVGAFPELGLFVVADGMGGHDDGEVASRMAIDVVHERVEPAGFWAALLDSERRRARHEPALDVLRRAIEVANERIYDLGQQRIAERGGRTMGTTVIALQCDGGHNVAVWAHVGDSRLYLARGGALRLLTADHTGHGEYYALAAEEGLQPEIPITLPHTNQLTRAVGTDAFVDVSTGTIDVQAGDRFLLCTDGVSGMIAPADLEQILVAGDPLAVTSDRLIQAALAGGGKDNASLVLVEVESL